MTTIFAGLSAFPLTPANDQGVVDTAALGALVDRLAGAGVDSIGLLGSTGIYAYLDRPERHRAVAAAIEAAAGRVPVIVGVGALRTCWAQNLASEAERAGARGLLVAPVSYTPLTQDEVGHHYRAIAASSDLPICVYNNPGTTNLTFTLPLIAEIAAIPNIAAIKMPLPADADYAGELARLAAATPSDFAVGYSGDWGAAPALLAGARAWYSVIAGLLPEAALRLTRAAQAGRETEAESLDAAFAPLWGLFRAHGSLRIMYAIADCCSLNVGKPPLPVRGVETQVTKQVAQAIASLEIMISELPLDLG